MNPFRARNAEMELRNLLTQYPIVTITGPRQAGKTSLVRMVCSEYFYVSLEDPDIRHLAEADPRGFLARYPAPAIFDEIQRVPSLLSYLQTAVDALQRTGLYVLTCSNQLHLTASVSQSLAGRTALLTLLPFDHVERAFYGIPETRESSLHYGYMPAIFDRQMEPYKAYRNYLQTYVERDVKQLLQVRNHRAFENCLRLLAARVGQLVNYTSLANELGVAVTTVQEWISLMEQSYILYRLQPYHTNYGKRLGKPPKIYFVEPGLACYLLGLEKPEQISRDPAFGGLFENMVILDILKSYTNRGKEQSMWFFRDHMGNEIDLLVEQQGKLQPIEIKSSLTWHIDFCKGLRWFHKLVPHAQKGMVIYGGDDRWESDEYHAIPWRQAGAIY